MKRFLALFLALLLCCTTGSAFGENEYDLPLDIEFENYAPKEENFTETEYHDDSLDVVIEYINYDSIKCYVARIKVKSPTQLRTATAGLPNQDVIVLPSVMDEALNAVVTINGDYYTHMARDSYIYRQGVMYRDKPDYRRDSLLIDDKGDFHIFRCPTNVEEVPAFEGTVINSFSFGPALIIDGETQPFREDYFVGTPTEWEWRTFIGQDGPLSYVFVVMQGCSVREAGRFAEYLGLQNAYTLDGGNSSVMLFHHKYVGDKNPDREREQSDIIYVVTAVP